MANSEYEWHGIRWRPTVYGRHTYMASDHGSLLHRQVWLEAHGPIPEGMAIAFVNGNELDCSIGNLTLRPARQLRTYDPPVAPVPPEPPAEPMGSYRHRNRKCGIKGEDGTIIQAPRNILAKVLASVDEYHRYGGDWKGKDLPPPREPPRETLDVEMAKVERRIGETIFGSVDGALRDPETGEELTPQQAWQLKRKLANKARRALGQGVTPDRKHKTRWESMTEEERERHRTQSRESKRRTAEMAMAMRMDGAPVPIPIPEGASREEIAEIRRLNRNAYHNYWARTNKEHLTEYRRGRRAAGITDRREHGKQEATTDGVLEAEGKAQAPTVAPGTSRLETQGETLGGGDQGTQGSTHPGVGGTQPGVRPTCSQDEKAPQP